MNFRKHVLTVVVSIGLTVTFVVGLLTYTGAAPWTGGYEASVMVPSAAAMGPGASVRISGQHVGKVLSVERKGLAAILKLQIDGARTPLPEDTRAAIRLRTLVGENYVELRPGSSRRTLPDGGILPMSQVDDYVDADQILSVLRGPSRERARRMLQDLGAGLDGHGGQLNTMLRGATGVVRAGDDVTAVLAQDRRQTAGLVADVGAIMREIGDRSAAVQQLATGARQTFAALAARNAALQTTLAELPPTLAQVRRTSHVVGSVSRSAIPVVDGLSGAINQLRPALITLPDAAHEARRVVRTLGAAAPPLTTTLGRVPRVAKPAATALPAVRDVLCQLNPAAEYLRPYASGLSHTLANMASSTNFYDATGHAARFQALVGLNSFTAMPDVAREALNVLVKTGALKATGGLGGYQPYPKPGDVGIPKGGEGDLGPMDSNLPYTRVKAAC